MADSIFLHYAIVEKILKSTARPTYACSYVMLCSVPMRRNALAAWWFADDLRRLYPVVPMRRIQSFRVLSSRSCTKSDRIVTYRHVRKTHNCEQGRSHRGILGIRGSLWEPPGGPTGGRPHFFNGARGRPPGGRGGASRRETPPRGPYDKSGPEGGPYFFFYRTGPSGPSWVKSGVFPEGGPPTNQGPPEGGGAPRISKIKL